MRTRLAPLRVLARTALALVAVVAAVGAGASSASAGGWAITTLDAVPSPSASEPFDVGFTILQHGTTPVDLEGVAINVELASGTTERFPAAQQGAPGHYVATVVLPADGDYTWSVQPGWFEEQPLGTLTVGAAAAAGGGGGAPGALAPALALLAVLLGAVAVVDLVRTRRRARPVIGVRPA